MIHQEAPQAFAEAVVEVDSFASRSPSATQHTADTTVELPWSSRVAGSSWLTFYDVLGVDHGRQRRRF
jgi:hypothetical protein